MNKFTKFLSLSLLLLLLCGAFSIFSSASVLYFDDGAETVTNPRNAQIESALEKLSEKYGYTVRICTATVNKYDSEYFDEEAAESAEAIARQYSDSIVLYLEFRLDGRAYRVAYSGKGRQVVENNDAYYYIEDRFLGDLRNDRFYDAYVGFIDACEYIFNTESTTGEVYKAPFNWEKSILIALVAGLVIALIVTLKMKGKLKSVKAQKTANYYVRSGSLNLTKSLDLYLYSTVTRTAKPKNTSSGSHSGGGGSGSRGGRF